MSKTLTICYQTCRREPHFEWFMDSLSNQLEDLKEPLDVCLVVVDFYASERLDKPLECHLSNVITVEPKPCVWQGEHRLTKEHWFAASNSRNTGLCLAKDGYIAYVDDLSVLCPGWLLNVRQSMNWNGVTLGAYRKVRNLVVENGNIISYDKTWPGGRDSRWNYGNDSGSVPANGDMLFGCSLVGPVEAFLSVGGWPELCDGLSFEDVIMGQAMENKGVRFMYNRNMLTFESDEHHGIEPAFRRDSFEKHPNDATDKGHAVLNMAKGGVKYFDNYYEGGIRRMREEVLSGKPFPIVQIPDRDWHTGRLLKDL